MEMIGWIMAGWLLISLAVAGVFLYAVGEDKSWREGGVAAAIAFCALAGIGVAVRGIFGG